MRGISFSRSAGVLLTITIVEIAVAHLTVEFGPQYLAHCLPLLTLMTGFCFVEMSQAAERLSAPRLERAIRMKTALNALVPAIMLLLCAYLAHWQVRPELRITDEEAQDLPVAGRGAISGTTLET